MEFDAIVKLLQEKGIKIVRKNGEIFKDERNTPNIPPYDHYAVIYENSKWYYVFSKIERVSEPIITKLKRFDNEKEALKYLFLKCLSNYFLLNSILPSVNGNIIDWNIDVILNVLKSNNIPEQYLSYDNKINKNSMYYYKDRLWFFSYIGKSGQIIAESTNGFGEQEKNHFLSGSINYIYLLFLLDEYEKELTERNFPYTFSDIDRADYLGLSSKLDPHLF